ncbi:MAG: tripartite tricarboxylate transporter permease [Bacillota bacterium]|nr:tripartite tricarboxylate transporter permease [Bacillota bacterium]
MEYIEVGIFLWVVVGLLIGILVGVLPGLGAATALSLLVPLTYKMDTNIAIAFIMGVFVGAVYGSSITSILLNIPGSATSVATMFDGYPLTVKGYSLTALGASITSSSIGGIAGALFLMFVSRYIANFFMHNMDSPSYFWIIMIALSCLITAIGKDRTIGFASALFGLMVGTIGMDMMSFNYRYNFGSFYMGDGIPMVPLILGIYALSHIMTLSQREVGESISKSVQMHGSLWEGAKQTLINWVLVIRSIIIGAVIGVFPGIGGATANLVAYYNAKSKYNQDDTFGKGDIRGVIAAEACNNATVASTLVPTFTLGIPGGIPAAILLSILMIHGLTPGPTLFTENVDFVNQTFVTVLIANLILFPIAILTLRFFARITTVKISILVPFLLVFVVYGVYGLQRSLYDVIIVFVFGLIGYLFNKYNIPIVPFLISYLLGPMFEVSLRRSLRAGDDIFILVSKPFHIVLAIIALLLIVGPPLYNLFVKKPLIKQA